MSDEITALAEVGKNSTIDMYQNRETMKLAYDAAKLLAASQLVPQTYQGKPENCLIAIDMANRMGVSPMIVMQNLYVVKGKPSWSGQACTSFVNNSGKFRDVKHVYTGTKGAENRGCYLSAVRIADGEQVDGPEVTIEMAKSEGWTSNTKWRNMPELMLAYRASAFFARVHCPEALMGIQTIEEIEDITPRATRKAPDVLGGNIVENDQD